MSVIDSEPKVGAHERLMGAISRLSLQLEEAMEGAVPLDMYQVLVVLDEAEGNRLTFCDLAERLALSRSGTTRRIDRMERKGYIRREACESDRRYGYAVMTAEGRQALDEARPTYEEAVAKYFGSRMTDGEARQLSALMKRIIDGIDRGSCDGPRE